MSSKLDEISPEEQDRMLKLLRKHRKALLAYPNVHSVDAGYEFSDGRSTGRLSIRVHVNKKVAESALSARDRLPTELDGVPVDVIESNPGLELVNPNVHIDPLIGGLTIGNTRATGVGTLGAIVFDASTLQPMALSNYHVMIVEPARADDVIAQPMTGGLPERTSQQGKGLGAAVANANGWVRWSWRVGTSTKRHNAGTGHAQGDPVRAFVTLDGVTREVDHALEGNPTTDI